MASASDTQVVTAPQNLPVSIDDALITPTGGTQGRLADKLQSLGGIGTLVGGANISITNPSGPTATIAATGIGSGTVTNVVTQGGPFLANGTITSTGTINNSTASLTAHGVIIAEGAGAAVATAAMTNGQLLIGASGADPAPQTMSGDATINSGGTFALGSIVAGATVGSGSIIPVLTINNAGRITNISTAAVSGGASIGNTGAVINSGTVQINNAVTLNGTATGTVSIAHTTGTSDVIVNMPSAGGTVTFAAAPTFVRQRAFVDIKQGATAGVVTLNSGFVFGASGGPTSFTVTATAAVIDRLQLMSPDGTKWAVLAINQGFTV
jgi:hypothetical protein